MFRRAFLATVGFVAAAPALAATPENKVVYHLSDHDKVLFTLGNIRNHYAAFPQAAPTLALVVHGEPLGDFRANADNERFTAPLRALVEKGLTPFACINTLHWLKLELGDLVPGFQVANRGGVVKLAELQQQGYAYIRP